MRYIFILLFLVACSPAQKLRKADRLKKEAIAEGAKVTHDTIFQEKKVLVKGDSTTILVPVIKRRDTTIYLTQDRIKIREVISHDTVKIFVQCPDSTVKVKEKISVNEQIICPPPAPWYYTWLPWVLIALMILWLIKKKA